MSTRFQAIRGMNDILPDQVPSWQFVEALMRKVMPCYGYEEIRLPLLESSALFNRAVGESTDIVEKETYTFADRNGDLLTLRPEGTAGCVRAGIEHGLFYHQEQRLWYLGPMFRHERPQKGRYRQFYQLGVEAYGMGGPAIEAELLCLSARLWRELGLSSCVKLQINSLGTPATRAQYRQALVDYLNQHRDLLDEESQRRLTRNPLRILDSKNPAMQAMLAEAPVLLSYLDTEMRNDFDRLGELLTQQKISFEINSRIVRGLDYYTGTVFEWTTEHLGAQSAICAGGRYDGLIEQLGGRPTSAMGFAIGMERLLLLIEQVVKKETQMLIDVYCVNIGETAQAYALELIEQCRDEFPFLHFQCDCTEASLKSQLKKADKSGAKIALILGEDEVKANNVSLKYLRADTDQQTVKRSELKSIFLKEFSQ